MTAKRNEDKAEVLEAKFWRSPLVDRSRRLSPACSSPSVKKVWSQSVTELVLQDWALRRHQTCEIRLLSGMGVWNRACARSIQCCSLHSTFTGGQHVDAGEATVLELRRGAAPDDGIHSPAKDRWYAIPRQHTMPHNEILFALLMSPR